MRTIIKVLSEGQIEAIEVSDFELAESFIKKNIGTSDGSSYFERTSFFNIKGIDIICDEEGKLKNLQPSLKLENDVIVGHCIVASIEGNEEGEFAWYGLKDEQLDVVIEKLVF